MVLIIAKNEIRKWFTQAFVMKNFKGLIFYDILMQAIAWLVKQRWANPLHFDFLPLKTIFSFIRVKSFLMKTLVFWLNGDFSLSKLCNFLLFNMDFLQCFRFRNNIVFKICFYMFIHLKKKGYWGWNFSFAFGAYIYMSENSTSFCNFLIKAHFMFSMSNRELICQHCKTSVISIYNKAGIIAKRAVKSI